MPDARPRPQIIAQRTSGSQIGPGDLGAAEDATDEAPMPGSIMGRGVGAFRDPAQMWVDHEATLEFAVARGSEGIQRELGEEAPPSEVREVFIGRCMRVTLEPNPAIRILSPNGEVRRLARDMDRASWSWSVMPLREGGAMLRARVEVLEQREGRCTDRVFDQYTERVPVNVRIGVWKGLLRALGEAKTLGDVLKALFSSWQGAVIALGALLTALGGLYGVLRKRSRPAGQSA